MNTITALADLDELVLLCRDDKARLYIVEAVACYRAGAYRSAIVATWIAVCYDIIDKLRELALSGDHAAEQNIEKLEHARASNNLIQTLTFERDILTLAKDRFELISHLEHTDLSRLQEDRNRCAHPSLVSQDQAFNPSGEMARLHIRSAVLHLLQHQPVQGKYALDRLLREVRSEYFPDSPSEAAQALASGPLKRPRDSLVRNFVIVLMKDFLTPTRKWNASMRVFAALSAVKQLHHRIFELTLKDRLPSLFRSLPDDELNLAVYFLTRFNDYWDILTPDVQLKLESYVSALPELNFVDIEEIPKYAPLLRHAERRVQHASKQEILNAFFITMPSIVVDECISSYLNSREVVQANEWASVIRMYANIFAADQQRQILRGIRLNSTLRHANTTDAVISRLRQTNRIAADEVESVLEQNCEQIERQVVFDLHAVEDAALINIGRHRPVLPAVARVEVFLRLLPAKALVATVRLDRLKQRDVEVVVVLFEDGIFVRHLRPPEPVLCPRGPEAEPVDQAQDRRRVEGRLREGNKLVRLGSWAISGVSHAAASNAAPRTAR
jgi:hypothetical protein